MSYRLFSLSALAFGVLAMGTAAMAVEDPAEFTHDGKVVSITDGKLVMTAKGDKEAKEHTFALAKDATYTLDGKVCKWADLKAGTKIRVTTPSKESRNATSIEAIAKNELFANTHDGKVVSVIGDELVMTGKDGKQHSHTLSTDAKFSCDGKVCKATDLKAGMLIRVTTRKGDPKTAICVEALKTGTEFAAI